MTRNASALGIGVANMSLGGPGASDGACGARDGGIQHAAICRSVAAGVTWVAAAGNARADFALTVPAAWLPAPASPALRPAGGRELGPLVSAASY